MPSAHSINVLVVIWSTLLWWTMLVHSPPFFCGKRVSVRITVAPLIFVSQVARTSSSRRHTIYNAYTYAWGSFVRLMRRLFDMRCGTEPPMHMHIYCSLLGEVLATCDTKLSGDTVEFKDTTQLLETFRLHKIFQVMPDIPL